MLGWNTQGVFWENNPKPGSIARLHSLDLLDHHASAKWFKTISDDCVHGAPNECWKWYAASVNMVCDGEPLSTSDVDAFYGTLTIRCAPAKKNSSDVLPQTNRLTLPSIYGKKKDFREVFNQVVPPISSFCQDGRLKTEMLIEKKKTRTDQRLYHHPPPSCQHLISLKQSGVCVCVGSF